MDARQIMVFIRGPDYGQWWTRTVDMRLEGVDAESRRTLFDRGFASMGDSAVLEIIANNAQQMHRGLIELERWIVEWAEKQGVEPVFRWRARR